MVVKRPIDEYLQKALDAEECARNTTDSEMRASWCGIAFGYRELARFRKESSTASGFGQHPVVQPSADIVLNPPAHPHRS